MTITCVGYKGYVGSEVFFRLKLLGLKPFGVDKGDVMPKSDITIHLASNIYGRTTKDFRSEIELTEEIVLKTKKKIVYTSSAAVYGNSRKPCRENQKLNPINEYGQAKVLMEHLITDCFSGKHSILRLANVYSREATHGFVSNLLKGQRTLYDRGQRTRDYVHLNDVVCVIIEAALTDKWNGIYNIGTGQSHQAREILKRLSGKTPVFKKKDEIERSVFDVGKARRKGFRPFEI